MLKYLKFNDFVQTMNILIVHQSVIDMFASFFTLLIAVFTVDGTGMSRDSIYDQFVCHIWLARQPLWYFLVSSTYGILLMALDRYVAVVHPIWQQNNVRTAFYRWCCSSAGIVFTQPDFSFQQEWYVAPMMVKLGRSAPPCQISPWWIQFTTWNLENYEFYQYNCP